MSWPNCGSGTTCGFDVICLATPAKLLVCPPLFPRSEVKYGLRGLWGGDCVAGGLEFGDGSLVAAFGLLVAVVVFFA